MSDEYHKKRYQEHKAEIIARSKQWKIDNKERAKELRRESNKEHAEEISEYMKQWHIDNSEHVSDYGKQYWIDNKEEIKKYHAEYLLTYNVDSKEKIQLDHEEYYEEHKEEILARLAADYAANPEPMKARTRTFEGRLSSYKAGAKTRGYPFLLTDDEFKSFWQEPCHYCADPIISIGLDRKDNKLGYIMANVVPCCLPCNRAKGTAPYEVYLSRIIRIAKRYAFNSNPYGDYLDWIA